MRTEKEIKEVIKEYEETAELSKKVGAGFSIVDKFESLANVLKWVLNEKP